MKKLLSFTLAIATLLSLSACKKECDHADADGNMLCDVCQAILGSLNIENDGCNHEWLPATCGCDGFCAKCGLPGEKAKDHTPGEFVVNLPALCGVKGESIQFCLDCEAPIIIEDIPALEHEWVGGVCIHCDSVEPEE